MWLQAKGIRALGLGLGMLMAGCAGTSYGVSADGTFPPKPAGAEYPSWEHMCVVFDSSNATQLLNDSGGKGWELVTLGIQGSDSLMCFKRPMGQ